jgi:superfamily II DNA/RNA helicase
MPIHPIKALEDVLAEYEDYIRTEFRAKDPALREALEHELSAPLFLAQEPFYQAHRPFKSGKRWRDLPLDAKLAGVLENRSRSEAAYLHQSQAIETLLAPDPHPHPVVVSTGTGSGKTEAFLLPVIENALRDNVLFSKSGLTAILIYPMNALANDQRQRISEYLREAGLEGDLRIEQYDRGTSQSKREEMRSNPPHVLLTNYVMLEYLLVRPADREGIFANHRCRFIVLDEVHTYRGALGSNIALLMRRLRLHLRNAKQDWKPDVSGAERSARYPKLIPVGTSATIKSMDEENLPHDELVRLRDEAVQEFFGVLTGEQPSDIRVFGEELIDVPTPPEAVYPVHAGRVDTHDLELSDEKVVHKALCDLTGSAPSTSLEDIVKRYRLLWDLNHFLIRKPMSVGQIVETIQQDVDERRTTSSGDLRAEIEAALALGAALPDGIAGSLRLRAHRFIRGGWKFHRCVNPECGKLYPMGEEKCSVCEHSTAPLYLCRNCGADYLRMIGDTEKGALRPSTDEKATPEWMLYEPARFESTGIDEEAEESEISGESGNGRTRLQHVPTSFQPRLKQGSFDPKSLQFSLDDTDYAMKVWLMPERKRCLCCGSSAGSRSIITPVTLGTSAAVKVLGEGLTESLADAHAKSKEGDSKERLLIFSDSRQDAAHQARFIIFASRYDRMRRNLMSVLPEDRSPMAFQKIVEKLGEAGMQNHDNPYAPREDEYLSPEHGERMLAWEEAPLLDEISITAGYRGTVINLGLVGVEYLNLDTHIQSKGAELAESLKISTEQLTFICKVILDEMRVRGAVSRELLRYHPAYPFNPTYIRSSEWERQIKKPQGFALNAAGQVVAFMDNSEVKEGIGRFNAWKRQGRGGQPPRLEKFLKHLLTRMGGAEPQETTMIALLELLRGGASQTAKHYLMASTLYGFREKQELLQINSETMYLKILRDDERLKCDVCGYVHYGYGENMPCPRCHGYLRIRDPKDVDDNRSVKRIKKPNTSSLVAGEHTAQVPNQDRLELENRFKATPAVSLVNVLACSPTLEMGIDVGGLDAVIMRNVPPRPDNYAQRGGRSGRRSRVGLVVGYARSTPHDQYFFDKPREMIAGEVKAPAVSLSNRDIFLRHFFAIAFSLSKTGLSAQMLTYVDAEGKIAEEKVNELIDSLSACSEETLKIAHQAWDISIFEHAGLTDDDLRTHLATMPERIRDIVDRTSKQVIDLRTSIERWSTELKTNQSAAAIRAGNLIGSLLGQVSTSKSGVADDRSAGYPLRRFAEFGLLPSYEFPTEPATLRLLGDTHEEDPISVTRRFGIGQFQPEAYVYARNRRWKVIGLDTASPWNPKADGVSWSYRICVDCKLRFSADEPKCPRCQSSEIAPISPAYEFAGFLARTEDRPIIDEEERFAVKNLVRMYPQWDGDVVQRWSLTNGWGLRLSKQEEVRWVNEGLPVKEIDIENGHVILNNENRGYLVCPTCGHMLEQPEQIGDSGKGRKKAKTSKKKVGGHSEKCIQKGQSPTAVAICCADKVEVLRILVPIPVSSEDGEWNSWGLSLGYSLLNGMQQHFMLSQNEIDFELEGAWKAGKDNDEYQILSLAFIDPNMGGSGYLSRIAEELHLVAKRAIEHLDHAGCDTACYRCLKTYQNQRYHDKLVWKQVMPVLEEMAQEPPTKRPKETGDIDDPKPWLEAYAAGVGSPLELKFLKEFEKYCFHPEKQVPVSPNDSEAPISIADFAVQARRIAIYVDGAAFHVGVNMKRDKFLRDKLRNGNPPWIVVELRAKDLKNVEALIQKFKEM